MGFIALGAMRRPSIADPRGGVIRRRGGPSPPCSPRGNLLTRAAKENIHGCGRSGARGSAFGFARPPAVLSRGGGRRGSLFGSSWGFRAASGFGANAGEARRGGRLRLASVRARRKRALIVLGRHLLAEFHDCGADALDDPARVERLMNEAARLSGATVVRSVFHAFSPHGVSGVVVVEESHLAVHTWPEYRYAAVDYFYCGDLDCGAALRRLEEGLLAARVETKEVARGVVRRREASLSLPFAPGGE